jgi:hypothetical protein
MKSKSRQNATVAKPHELKINVQLQRTSKPWGLVFAAPWGLSVKHPQVTLGYWHWEESCLNLSDQCSPSLTGLAGEREREREREINKGNEEPF